MAKEIKNASNCDCGCSDKKCGNGQCGMHGCGHHKKIIFKLVGLALVAYLIVLTVATWGKMDEAPAQLRTISVNGQGKITAAPNIALVSVGLVTENVDVGAAQTENTKKMNKLIALIKSTGVADADIQTTQYQINPKYSYAEKTGSQITGYNVTQSADVKIRDLTKISVVLAKAGEAGANQISGLQFTVDEPSNLKAEARDKAVADAKDKAGKLAKSLDVHLKRVVNFGEFSPISSGPMLYKEAMGMGGGVDMPVPTIQTGSLEINSEVTITYEIK